MKSNFTKFQEKLFERLWSEGNIVFATAGKGLRSVAVALVQYIKDGLIHFQDKHTYTIIAEKQALQDNIALHLAIQGYIRCLMARSMALVIDHTGPSVGPNFQT